MGTLFCSWFSLVEVVGSIFRVSWAGWLAIGESVFFIPIEVYALLPGSTQLDHAKKFLLTLPLHQLAPATKVFTGATSAAITTDGRRALAFAAKGQAVSVDLARLSGSATARWFDPTSGELKAIEGSPFPNTGARESTPPCTNAAGESDWVLVLEAK